MKECPKCNIEMEIKPNMFHWRGEFFDGYVCLLCNGLWDIDDQFLKYALTGKKNEKEDLSIDGTPV